MSKTFTKSNPMHKSSQYFNIKYGADGSESMSHHSCYKFQVIKGNNANLVTKILSAKQGWVDISSLSMYSGQPNFKWTPVSVKSEFQNRPGTDKFLYNHYENHREITRKNDLFSNLTAYCNSNSDNVFDLVPMTFHIFVSAGRAGENMEVALKKFDAIFASLEVSRHMVQEEVKLIKNQAGAGRKSGMHNGAL